MIYLAIGFLIAATVTGAIIDGRRRPGTPRDWHKQIPTLIALAVSLVFFAMAGAGL